MSELAWLRGGQHSISSKNSQGAMIERCDNEPVLPQVEVVKAVGLLGRIAGMRSDLCARRRALMTGLAQMIDADCWLWSATRVDPKDGRPVSAGAIHGDFSEQALDGMVRGSLLAQEQPPEDPIFSQLFSEGQHVTRTRQQILADDQWYRHPVVQEYRLNRGIDHFLYSIYPLDQHCCSAIGFFRHVGRDPFNDLQRRMCHIVVSNVDWLHQAIFPDHKGSGCIELTLRQRMVLIHLLDGKQRDDIARILHISPETAKTHIRRIYQHFSVKSQVELMRHFQMGNGLDVT